MRAAFFNPDRAVDYLLTGIPENIQAEQRESAGAAARNPQTGAGLGAPGTQPPSTETGSTTAPTAGTGTAPSDEPINLFEAAAQAGGQPGGGRQAAASAGAGAGAGAAAGIGNPQSSLDFLRNSPQFQQLRQLVQQQPGMLEPVLQQVAEGNPQLAQMIQQNQDQFLQLLGEVWHDFPFYFNWPFSQSMKRRRK